MQTSAQDTSKDGSTPDSGMFHSTPERQSDDTHYRDRLYENAAKVTDTEDPGSRRRRLMELRLMQYWMGRGHQRWPLSSWRKIWFVEIPCMALGNDHVLYGLLALSATMLSGISPPDPELSLARHTYWTLALREQQLAVSQSTSTAHVEPLAIAALLISINAFATLRGRDLDHYTPPTEWFEVAKAVKEIFPREDSLDPNSTLAEIVNIVAPIRKTDTLASGEAIHEDYRPLLRCNPSAADGEDMETYEKTVAYISAFRRAVYAGEPVDLHLRRICLFPQVVPPRFLDLLHQRRPRALVILACFFAVTAISDSLYFLGDMDHIIPQREVRAIANLLSDEWQGYMIRPLDDTLGDMRHSDRAR